MQSSAPSIDLRKDWGVTVTSLAAVVLLLASLAKARALVRTGINPSAASQLTLVLAEWVLAWWLISAWKPVACRVVATTAFSAFSVASLWKLLQHAPSCGCFGSWQVPPAATLIVDLVLAAALGF